MPDTLESYDDEVMRRLGLAPRGSVSFPAEEAGGLSIADDRCYIHELYRDGRTWSSQAIQADVTTLRIEVSAGRVNLTNSTLARWASATRKPGVEGFVHGINRKGETLTAEAIAELLKVAL